MNRIFLLFSVFAVMSLTAHAREIKQSPDSLYTIRGPLPISENNGAYYSLNDELAFELENILNDLNLFDIVIGIYIDTVGTKVSKPIQPKDIYSLNQLGRFREAIVFTESFLFQDTLMVEARDQEGLVGSLINSDKTIATEIEFSADFIDINKQQVLGSLNEKAYYEHKDPHKSKMKAIASLKDKVHRELKRIYWFSSEFSLNENNILIVPLGRKQGVYKGHLFEIVEPDRIWEDDEGEYIEDGGVVGLASVKATSRDSCEMEIVREWQPFYPESWIVEHSDPIYALQFMLVPPTTFGFFTAGAGIHARPMGNFDLGFGIHFASLDDSFGEKTYGLGFEGFGIWRFLNTSQIDIGTILGVDLDIPFRKDHENNIVSTMLLSSYLGISGEFPLSSHIDFIAISGYRFGMESDSWEYSDDEETFPAYWDEGPPSVNNNGFMMSLGFKLYGF
jgi:hypothetical protein